LSVWKKPKANSPELALIIIFGFPFRPQHVAHVVDALVKSKEREEVGA
jgi:hypothetical protein